MNDEIKEILDFKENADYKKLSCDEIAILKDYITNLQKETERLKEENKYLDELEKSESEKGFKWINLEQVFEVINKQQARIEKAVEYIENDENFWVALGEDCGKANDDLDKLLNILNGKE